ncbi:TonB-dependent receptor plug domain-containing protein [Lutimaribacter marinistellae]|uniref:TonB-dependent receptor plug domain-containing protein n=1 Tax=Lutimaribacter marinistellae TaxID=1820329 RepID=A0ABV7TEY6_9RHOB
MTKLLTSASILALGLAPAAVAQEAFDLGQIKIFSTVGQNEIDLDRTGATVEVLTEDEIRAAPETRVADYLAKLPGVSVSANGGLGANTTLRVRGLDGKYIKVLIDGIDVTDPAAPQTSFNWGNLTTSGISRIELLKGSSSAIYGSRAIAGVVNITTARPEEPGTVVSGALEAGSFDTYQGTLGVATQGERGGAAFTFNHVDTDGFSSRDGAANTEDDGFRATRFNFSGDFQATDMLTLGLSGYYLDAEGAFDEFGGDGAPPFDEWNTTESLGLRAFAAFETGALTHRLSTSYFRSDRVSSSNGFDSIFDGERRRVDYVAEGSASDQLRYSFGADWEEEEFATNTDSGSVQTTGVFGELLFAPTTDLDLSATLRYDDHSTFGGNLSGRLAAAYRLSEGTILRAVAATGFRAPSLYELNSTLYGNAALEPEESLSFELGVEHQFGNGSFVKATGFYTEIDNLIQFVTLTSFPLPFTGQYQQTPGTSTSKGIELSGLWAITDTLALIGAYTYTDAEDATGARLLRVPGHDFVLGLEAEMGERWAGTVTLNHVADRPDEFGTVMPDYTVVNASVAYDINDRTEAYMRVVNLFDEQYQTSANFSASDRAVYFGVRARF